MEGNSLLLVIFLFLILGATLRALVVNPWLAKRRLQRDVRDEVNRREHAALHEDLVQEEIRRRHQQG